MLDTEPLMATQYTLSGNTIHTELQLINQVCMALDCVNFSSCIGNSVIYHMLLTNQSILYVGRVVEKSDSPEIVQISWYK